MNFRISRATENPPCTDITCMDTGLRELHATRPLHTIAGICGGGWRAALIAGTVTWWMTANGAPAANLSASFAVSVQVVANCRLEPTGSLPRASVLQVACPRGTGYQILWDGRAIGAGRDGGVAPIQLPVTAGAVAASGAPAAQLHWLTILY